mmetsp:Transcript_41331/g.119620  ORF Transcript_41331/g.119620 Transcript_41331/m.119620 type:complete len:663 (-) Transcript_41331:1065-3053(-)
MKFVIDVAHVSLERMLERLRFAGAQDPGRVSAVHKVQKVLCDAVALAQDIQGFQGRPLDHRSNVAGHDGGRADLRLRGEQAARRLGGVQLAVLAEELDELLLAVEMRLDKGAQDVNVSHSELGLVGVPSVPQGRDYPRDALRDVDPGDSMLLCRQKDTHPDPHISDDTEELHDPCNPRRLRLAHVLRHHQKLENASSQPYEQQAEVKDIPGVAEVPPLQSTKSDSELEEVGKGEAQVQHRHVPVVRLRAELDGDDDRVGQDHEHHGDAEDRRALDLCEDVRLGDRLLRIAGYAKHIQVKVVPNLLDGQVPLPHGPGDDEAEVHEQRRGGGGLGAGAQALQQGGPHIVVVEELAPGIHGPVLGTQEAEEGLVDYAVHGAVGVGPRDGCEELVLSLGLLLLHPGEAQQLEHLIVHISVGSPGSLGDHEESGAVVHGHDTHRAAHRGPAATTFPGLRRVRRGRLLGLPEAQERAPAVAAGRDVVVHVLEHAVHDLAYDVRELVDLLRDLFPVGGLLSSLRVGHVHQLVVDRLHDGLLRRASSGDAKPLDEQGAGRGIDQQRERGDAAGEEEDALPVERVDLAARPVHAEVDGEGEAHGPPEAAPAHHGGVGEGDGLLVLPQQPQDRHRQQQHHPPDDVAGNVDDEEMEVVLCTNLVHDVARPGPG